MIGGRWLPLNCLVEVRCAWESIRLNSADTATIHMLSAHVALQAAVVAVSWLRAALWLVVLLALM